MFCLYTEYGTTCTCTSFCILSDALHTYLTPKDKTRIDAEAIGPTEVLQSYFYTVRVAQVLHDGRRKTKVTKEKNGTEY